MLLNDISGEIVDSAMQIHKTFGPGLFESVYERLLQIELERRGHRVKRQLSVSFVYGAVCFKNAFRIDLLVDDAIVVELKSVSTMQPVFAKQVKTYLVLTEKRIGLVINFGMALLKDGIVRMVNQKFPNVLPVGKTVKSMRLDLNLSEDCESSVTQLCGSAAPREKTFSPELRPDGENALCGSAAPREKNTLSSMTSV